LGLGGMNKGQLQSIIYDYQWQKKEVDRIKKILWGIDLPPTNLVAQYGIEATMPRSNTSIKSKYELADMDMREQRLYKRYERYKKNTDTIERLGDYASTEWQLIILDCMMEGMSYRSIADHLGTNRNKVTELKDSMLNHLCQKCHLLHDLRKDKVSM